MDMVTKACSHLVIAHFCVMADLSKLPPKKIDLGSEFGIWLQSIANENARFVCNNCSIRGHSEVNCPKKSKPKLPVWKIWHPNVTTSKEVKAVSEVQNVTENKSGEPRDIEQAMEEGQLCLNWAQNSIYTKNQQDNYQLETWRKGNLELQDNAETRI